MSVRVRKGSGRADAAWVADFAEVVAVGLAAGLDLPTAALASARSPGVADAAPWLVDRLQVGIGQGRGVSSLLDPDVDLGITGIGGVLGVAEGEPARVPGGARTAREPDLGSQACGDLSHLMAAWRLAEGVGAAASAVTASAALSVRERQAAAQRTAVVVAGPRASMLLLSALPLAGPVAALVIGMPPGRLYDSAASRVLAATGLALTVLGWWWARGLLSRARRPGRTDGVPC